MIDREQLARVLDPEAWEAGYILRRESSLAAAEQLLSDPRYAVVELPGPDHGDGIRRWHGSFDSYEATDRYSVRYASDAIERDAGGVELDALAMLAAARAADQAMEGTGE